MSRTIILLCCSAMLLTSAREMPGQDLQMWKQFDIPLTCARLPMTMVRDALDRPLIYVAQKEAGVTCFNVADSSQPEEVWAIGPELLEGLHATSLVQRQDRLYVALGDIFKRTQPPGLAVIDVSDPNNPLLLDVWAFTHPTSGAGHVVVDGHYAYLAAMQHGLIVLDIQGDTIDMVTQFEFDLDFPDPDPDTAKYNLRGLAVENNILYCAFDAGGLRLVNVTDPSAPQEIGRYSNAVLNGRPRAYNNVAVQDGIVYVTVDYCGLEILDVATPSAIKQLSWWNPWGCPGNNWFTSPGHTNEIALDTACMTVFMSTGRSDMYVVDVSDPLAPDSISVFGTADDTEGTWGVSQADGKVLLSYICTLGIPFQGTWSGIRGLRWQRPCATNVNESATPLSAPTVFPNPASRSITISLDDGTTPTDVWLTDVTGSRIMVEGGFGTVNIGHVANGVYMVHVRIGERLHSTLVLIQH